MINDCSASFLGGYYVQFLLCLHPRRVAGLLLHDNLAENHSPSIRKCLPCWWPKLYYDIMDIVILFIHEIPYYITINITLIWWLNYITINIWWPKFQHLPCSASNSATCVWNSSDLSDPSWGHGRVGKSGRVMRTSQLRTFFQTNMSCHVS